MRSTPFQAFLLDLELLLAASGARRPRRRQGTRRLASGLAAAATLAALLLANVDSGPADGSAVIDTVPAPTVAVASSR